MVSVDPIITDAAFDTKQSGPSTAKISLARANVPLPDTGRSSAKFTNWEGTPRRLVNGDIRDAIRSIVPDARSTPIAAISPISGVAIENTAENPSFAPVVKVSNIFIFARMPAHIIMHTSTGMAYMDIMFTICHQPLP